MAEIIFNPPKTSSSSLKSQIENFQTTLASLNQQVIILQETLQKRDKEITDLKMKLSQASQTWSGSVAEKLPKIDDTLTIVGIFIKLYKSVFPSGKDSAAPIAE